MSVATEQALNSKLYWAQQGRAKLAEAVQAERDATMAFMDEALAARWSWEAIGRKLGISGTGARRYHQRNKRKVHSV